jgi:hypothetical protein
MCADVKAGKSFDEMMAAAYATRMNERVGDITIDTTDTIDAGWETALVHEDKDGGISIAENYETEEAPIIGHKKWVERVKRGLSAADFEEMVDE